MAREEIAASEILEFKSFGKELVRESRALILRMQRNGFSSEFKTDGSPVTEIDIAAERLIRSRIASRYPDHGIVGEELEAVNPQSEFKWILDPIDGTSEFLRGTHNWGTLVALWYNDKPILSIMDFPMLDQCVIASLGNGVELNGIGCRIKDNPSQSSRVWLPWLSALKRDGDETWMFYKLLEHFPQHFNVQSCYGFLYLLMGGADVALLANVNLWDVATVRLVFEEAGGKYVSIKDGKLVDGKERYSAIFGHPAAVDDALSYLGVAAFK